MKYHKDQMLKHGGLFVLFFLLAIGALIGFIYAIIDDGSVASIIIFVLMFAYLGFMTWSNASSFVAAQKQYNIVRDSGLLADLENINPYPTHSAMLSAVQKELQNIVYEDDEIFITDSFLGAGNFVLLIDGILDARVVVHKTNGITDKIELIVLYYDGEKTVFEYGRPVSVQKCTSNLEDALNLIARKSKLFRKYDCCRL